jgi:curlin associated repeat protein
VKQAKIVLMIASFLVLQVRTPHANEVFLLQAVKTAGASSSSSASPAMLAAPTTEASSMVPTQPKPNMASNTTELSQIGANNLATLTQLGANNLAVLSQEGRGNVATLTQSGRAR